VGERCRITAREHLHWDVAINRLAKAYRQLLEDSAVQ
jgi:hypothetical protein